MQKMVAVMSKQVKDLSGLYIELRRQSFNVLNVGSDQTGTYVYLSESEMKDPTPFVEEWAEKPAPTATKGEVRRLKEEIGRISPPKPPPLTIMIPNASESPLPAVDTSSQESALEDLPKENFLKKLFKNIFS